MTREDQSLPAPPCPNCAGRGWKYVTTKTAIPAAGEHGWSGMRQRRACRACGGVSVDEATGSPS
jgi:hypothetical protein